MLPGAWNASGFFMLLNCAIDYFCCGAVKPTATS